MRTPLARLLSLVAAAEAAGGDIDADDAARLLGVSLGELGRQLEQLSNFGVTPFEPGDHLDLELDGDRVVLHQALGLERPLRLSSGDVALLGACLRALRVSLDGAGRALCDRTLARLAQAAAGPGEPEPIAWSVEEGVDAGALAAARAAAAEHRELEIVYWNASRDSLDRRRVRPLSVVQHKGRWYLQAWCSIAREPRHFRLDRVLDVAPQQETFDPAALPAPRARRDVLFDAPTRDLQVVVWFPEGRLGSARRFFQGGRHGPQELGEGRLGLSASALPVLFRSLLTFGPPFRVDGPEPARAAFIDWLRRSVA